MKDMNIVFPGIFLVAEMVWSHHSVKARWILARFQKWPYLPVLKSWTLLSCFKMLLFPAQSR